MSELGGVYRNLKSGELIESGDQYKGTAMEEWKEVGHNLHGHIYKPNDHYPIRRSVTASST